MAGGFDIDKKKSYIGKSFFIISDLSGPLQKTREMGKVWRESRFIIPDT